MRKRNLCIVLAIVLAFALVMTPLMQSKIQVFAEAETTEKIESTEEYGNKPDSNEQEASKGDNLSEEKSGAPDDEVSNEGETDEPKDEVPSTEQTDPNESMAEGEKSDTKVNVTLIVTGSKIIEKKEDHATAHEEWLKETLAVDKDTIVTQLTKLVLDKGTNERSVTIFEGGSFGSFMSAITVAGKTNTTGVTNGDASFWSLFVNDIMSGSGMDGVEVSEGDVIEWRFINDPLFPRDVREETADPALELKATPDYWVAYSSGSRHNAFKLVEGTIDSTFELVWNKTFGKQNSWGFYDSRSDFLVIGGNLYFAYGNKLVRVDNKGEVSGEESLRAGIGFFGRLAYDYGLVLVALEGGAVQAIDAKTMKTKWVAESQDKLILWKEDDSGDFVSSDYPVQSLSTLLIADKVAYVATTAVDQGATPGGTLRAIDMATGKTLWSKVNSVAGYYWSGPIKIGKWVIIGGDDGKISAFDTTAMGESKDANSFSIKHGIRSTLVHADNKIYFTTVNGSFHEIEFNESTGQFGKLRSVSFGTSSTTTPTIFGGKAYIGGATKQGWPAEGVFAVIDIAKMTVLSKFDIEGDMKAAPLVLVDESDNPKVFFTTNANPGSLFLFDGEKISEAYQPPKEMQNFSTSSPVTDGKGTIYFTNDSGHVFAIRMSLKKAAPTTTPVSKPKVPVAPPTGETMAPVLVGVLLISIAVIAFMGSKKSKKESFYLEGK